MEIISYTKARNQFASVMDRVCDDHEPIIISKQEQRPVVLMSLDDFNSIVETLYLLKSRKNAEQLYDGLEDFKEGKNFVEINI